MNPLEKFEILHLKKILKELKQAGILLTEANIPLIIKETSFEIRSQKHPNECPYYEKRTSCHNIEDLNCFLCICPEYSSDKDEGGCKLNHQSGKWHSPYPYSQSRRVWDCSDCPFPHFPTYVEQYLRKNLEELKRMREGI